MEFNLLKPSEAAALLKLPSEEVIALIEQGKLGAFRDNDQWWIPLKCLADLTGHGIDPQAVEALELMLDKHSSWLRSFDAHPEAVAEIEATEFPPGSVGVCLQQALAIARRRNSVDAALAPSGVRRK